MITTDSVPARSDVPWRNIDGNVIVVRPMDGVLYPLNSVATRIWLLLDGTKQVSEIIDTVAAEFEGEEDQIRKDVFLFLEELEKASLIQIDHSSKTVSQKKE